MDLFQHIKTNTLLLTPNRRLAAYYTNQYQLFQLSQNKNHWTTLDILPLSSWLERLWKFYTYQEMTETRLLLSSDQELILWEKIITQAKTSEHLLQVSPTADLAKSAWGLLKQWQIELNHPTLALTEDSSTFLEWANLFQQECTQKNWLDSNSLATMLSAQIKNKKIPAPANIILIGFTEISPGYQQLIKTCESAGSTVEYYLQKNKNNSIQRTSLTDTETEILTVARWAKNIYAENKTASIGCIVPNLEDHRDTVSRIFTEVFTEAGYYTLDTLTLPFNISAGKSLASYPIIHTALQLLELQLDATISTATLGSILRSPFLGGAEKEMLRRAEFDNQLRQANISGLTLADLNKTHTKPNLTTSCPLLAEKIKVILDQINNTPKKQPINKWVNIFMEILTLYGWPGERSLNSEEYQVVQSFIKVFNKFNSLEMILDTTSYKNALHYLNRVTGSTVFQPESPQTTIQILGVLEAAEIPFDYLWIMGMDDASWPPSPQPNPFIPQQLQKKLHMPHATAERELNFCKKMTEQLKNSANTVIFSHALHNDVAEARASALITDVPEIKSEELSLADYTLPRQIIFASKQLELLHDDMATPVTNPENISGGAKIFELQAACPFKAFAELRLYARPIEATTLGLRAYERGNIVHIILELIWNELKDSTTLHSKTNEELSILIDECIRKAMQDVTDKQSDSSKYYTLEFQRLQNIIMDWMQIEKQRPPFKVMAQEQAYQVTIANLSINLRIDRIDQLAENNNLIIDYKTGKNNNPADWFGPRPDSPQLPLYCVIDPANTAGIAFGLINTEKMELQGISKHNLNIPKVAPLAESKVRDANFWEQQLQIWREVLEKLGHDFYQGKAEVDPKHGMQTCEHCKLKPFCRIYEKSYE